MPVHTGLTSRINPYVVMSDDSAHNHAFVLEAADIVFRSHFEAVRYLKNLVKGTSEEVE